MVAFQGRAVRDRAGRRELPMGGVGPGCWRGEDWELHGVREFEERVVWGEELDSGM